MDNPNHHEGIIMDYDTNKAHRTQTAQQKLNNFLRSDEGKTYPLCSTKVNILHALASYFYYNLECHPSLASLADYARLNDSENISDHLYGLQLLGLIDIKKENGKSNVYTWKIPLIEDKEIYRKKAVNKDRKTKKPPG